MTTAAKKPARPQTIQRTIKRIFRGGERRQSG
jgi:hypothetical protein